MNVVMSRRPASRLTEMHRVRLKTFLDPLPEANRHCVVLGRIRRPRILVAALLSFLVLAQPALAIEVFDVIAGIIDSPHFKGKDPLERLHLAAELLRSKKVKDADMTFILLDWSDRFLREPTDPLERLIRWAELINDEKLKNLKLPRDFLNRMVLAEYLIDKTAYLKSLPHKKLEILGALSKKNLVDWSVSLTYARIYAGGIIAGAKTYQNTSPLEALNILKKLKDEDLVEWHYRVPSEGVLIAEALAMDKDYQNAGPLERLVKLRDLERKGIISPVTRHELEKLPAWRLLLDDPAFIKADASAKRQKLSQLKSDGLISAPTWSALKGIFRTVPLASPLEARPAPPPQKMPGPGKQ